MAIGIASIQALYQTYYPDSSLAWLLPMHLPLLNMVQLKGRTGTASGDVIDMPWLYTSGGGVSQSFDAASSMSGQSPAALRPQVRLSQMYKRIEILDKDNLLSNGEAAYQSLMETTVGGFRMKFLSEVDLLLHGSGSGTRHQVSSAQTGSATNVLLLVGASVETSYEIGDQVVITSNNPTDGTAPTVTAGPFTVTGVDPTAQSITIDNSIVTTSANFVALFGNTMGFSSALQNPSLIGLDAYNNFTAPLTSDNFLGVNRSVYANRLSGYRLDGSNFSVQTAIKRLASNMVAGGTPSGGAFVLMHPDDLDAMDTSLASNQRFAADTQVGAYSFESIEIRSTLGTLSVVSDPHIAKGTSRIIKPGALELHYIDGLPHLASLNTGLDQEWGANFDGRALRMRAYLQLRCPMPNGLGVVKLPAVN